MLKDSTRIAIRNGNYTSPGTPSLEESPYFASGAGAANRAAAAALSFLCSAGVKATRWTRSRPVWKSKFHGAFDATPARRHGDAGSLPLDGARTAACTRRTG